ncbi:hypothetical protein MWU75_10560 [Ornithinimicrobium sp. F0845]|uniref:hypothetical protein n=1 Tax=Ornithinimicrobium sp. F0845 TaxID=2926412 RepID=UPI001FF5DC06|nr:hypothetical protein [Ornithinimicrobium sp. F0845]MCK0112581.1 hypothetical protein [Ornithinimicrobium sp. F0845]
MSTAHEPDRVEIRLRGHLDERWSSWFDGLTVELEADGVTLLRGRVADQSALHGLLARLRDLGIPLISVAVVPVPSQQSRTRGTQP